MAVPTVASSSSASLSSGTNLTITKPTGLASGDLMVAFMGAGGAPTLSPPSGSWTAIGSAVTDVFSGCRSHAWYKVADSTDAAASDFTFTRSTSGNASGGIVRIYGFDTTTPINVSATGSATSGTSQTSPTVTTTVADCLILRGMTSAAATITTSGVTQLWSVATSTPSAAGYESQASAGATGTDTWTFSFTSQMTAKTIAIAPGSGGGSSPPIFTSDGGGSTATVHIYEGATTVTTCVASGIPSPTYSITGGANSGSYSINSSSGALTRNSGISYGAPEVVEVTATNTGGTDVQTITVVCDPTYTGTAPAAPLDDAEYFYRPIAAFNADNTQYANYGTRDEVLILGDDYTASAKDPDWSAGSGEGAHLVYTDGENYAHAVAPQAIIDATSFTGAVRVRWNELNTIGTLFLVIKDIGTDTKTIFLHKQSDNTYECRIWDGTTESQVSCVSTTIGSLSVTHTIVMTYDGGTRELLLYINGTEEDDATSTNARRLVGHAGYLEWPVGVGLADLSLSPDCKFFRMAYWDRCLSPSEVTALGSNAAWTGDDPISGGGGGGLLASGLLDSPLIGGRLAA